MGNRQEWGALGFPFWNLCQASHGFEPQPISWGLKWARALCRASRGSENDLHPPVFGRCYITLTQSLHLTMSGAPSGPAGTGKTETTKDLGRALGIMIYVFNCSEQMDYKVQIHLWEGLRPGLSMPPGPAQTVRSLCPFPGVLGVLDPCKLVDLPINLSTMETASTDELWDHRWVTSPLGSSFCHLQNEEAKPIPKSLHSLSDLEPQKVS